MAQKWQLGSSNPEMEAVSDRWEKPLEKKKP